MRTETYQKEILVKEDLENGIEEVSRSVLVEVIDERTLEDAQAEAVQVLRDLCGQTILLNVSEEEQRSLSLGLYDAEKTARLKALMQESMDKYHRVKAKILATTTTHEADSVNWHLES